MTMLRMTRRPALAAVLAAALVVATGGAAWGQASSAPPVNEVQRLLRITDGVLPSEDRLISVQKGDLLRWRITSNQPGELHLHAYRLSAKLTADKAAELAFTANATGRFRVEWHPAVTQPAAPGAAAHHGPALATLEVHPR